MRTQMCLKPLTCFVLADSKLNLAEGRPAFQSTTQVHEGVSHNASLATDGSTSLTKATCSKTGRSSINHLKYISVLNYCSSKIENRSTALY